MSNYLDLSWRDILDCKLGAGTWLRDFIHVASITHYKYIAWNGIVYFIGDGYKFDKVCLVSEIGKNEDE